MTFDVEQAIKDGLQEDQILDYLGQVHNFDTQKAINEGVPKKSVIDYLSKIEYFPQEEQRPELSGIEQAKEVGIGALKSGALTAKETLEQPSQVGQFVPEQVGQIAEFIPQVGRAGVAAVKGVARAGKFLAEKIPESAVTPEGELQQRGFIGGQIAQLLAPTPFGKVGAGKALIKGGEKITKSIVRPLDIDIKAGFKVENITKHNVGGNLEDILRKSTEKIKTNIDLLKKTLGAAKERGSIVDVFSATRKSVQEQGLKQFGDLRSTDRALDEVKKEISAAAKKGLIAKDGTMSIDDLQVLKQAAGLKGAWQHGKPDQDAKALESVYNAFYLAAKEEIERKSPPGVKEINRILHELIPIQQAVIRRIPVADRQNVLSLTDILTLGSSIVNPQALGLFIANRFLKSGKVGEAATKVGQFLKGKGESPATQTLNFLKGKLNIK